MGANYARERKSLSKWKIKSICFLKEEQDLQSDGDNRTPIIGDEPIGKELSNKAMLKGSNLEQSKNAVSILLLVSFC